MRRHLLLLLALASLLAIPVRVHAEPGKLIVHEWGTFTSFAGSDGVYLDYRTRVGGDLPDFVLDRQRQASASTTQPTQFSPYLFSKGAIPTLSRMETPVTYFYTDRWPTKVQVNVDFPSGLFTEFYPPIKKMTPIVTAAEKSGKALPIVGGGMLDWGDVTLIPQMTPMEVDLPIVSQGDHYAAARDTDSDYVQVTDSHGVIHSEKFLFYRGICNIYLPLDLKCLGHDQFQLSDPGNTPITAAFLIQIEGGKVRFQRYGEIHGPRMLKLPSEQSSLDSLADAMTHDLTASGLYDKEANAMVATWRTSWFGEDGTRLLYILPAAMADANLPLTITPKPQKMVRVMVGRLEAMTPEREHDLIQRLGGDGQINDLGRFAEPALHRIIQITQDPHVKARAQALLTKLHN
jgi:hypothetical protein